VTGLPPIDQSLLPADIRKAGPADRQKYTVALGFERALVAELAKTMAETAKPIQDEGDDSQQQDAAGSMYREMLPDQLTDSITQHGGLGLARTFYESMKERGQ
jgi:Rod binding domain-containing protein